MVSFAHDHGIAVDADLGRLDGSGGAPGWGLLGNQASFEAKCVELGWGGRALRLWAAY